MKVDSNNNHPSDPENDGIKVKARVNSACQHII